MVFFVLFLFCFLLIKKYVDDAVYFLNVFFFLFNCFCIYNHLQGLFCLKSLMFSFK